MRSIGPETQAALLQGGLEIAILARGVLRDPVAGAETVLTIWDGAYDREFTTEHGTELYTGVGAGLVLQPIEQVIGLDVVQARLTLSGASEELVSQILGLDARAAPIEVWQVAMAGRVLDAPVRVFDGRINGLEFLIGAAGEPAAIEATLVPRTVDLVHGPTRRWSHASQLARGINASVFGSPTIYTSAQIAGFASAQTVKVVAVGGGGGGASGTGGAGDPGTATTAYVKDASGNIVATLSASGGAGGDGKSSWQKSPPPGPLRPDADYGEGGLGGPWPATDPYRWGNPGNTSTGVTWSGAVGAGWSIDIVQVGAGGAGGGSSSIAGNPGKNGAVGVFVGQPVNDNFMRWAHVEERTVIWGP